MTDHDLKILACTVWGEARQGGRPCMEHVAHVIFNRVEKAHRHIEKRSKPHPLFGDGTVANACGKAGQFDCWKPKDRNYPKLTKLMDGDSGELSGPDATAWHEAIGIASAFGLGPLDDPTFGATHYHAKNIAPPYWAHGEAPCFEDECHFFYNSIK